MICFVCPQCSRQLRVANIYAGRMGCCPSCKVLLTIPLNKDALGRYEKVDSKPAVLTAAVADGRQGSSRHFATPLQRPSRHCDEEVDLSAASKDSCDDTHILPAEHIEMPPTASAEIVPSPSYVDSHFVPARSTRLVLCIVVMGILVAIILTLLTILVLAE